MNRIILIKMLCVSILILSCFFIGCINSSPVKEIFDKEWVDGNISKEDKITLEKYFQSNGDSIFSEYWDLCFWEGADTTGKKNPWQENPVQAKEIEVSVYIDNSSSMEGYFKSSMSAPVIEVLSAIQQYYSRNDIRGYYVDKDRQSQFISIDLDSLISDLTMKKIKNFGDSYQLDGLIGKMVQDYNKKKSNKRVISFFITDGIPSGSNDEINGTRPQKNFNIVSASTLQSKIARKFINVKGLAASVYRFRSGFEGEYWYYNNAHKRKSIPDRPFYVLVLGDRDLVSEFAEKESQGLNFFESENKVHFGAIDKSLISFFHDSVDSDSFDESDTIQILAEIVIKGLPYFARTETFLKNNMDLKVNNDSCNWVLNNGIIRIPLTVEQYNSYIIDISIRNSTPSWVDEFTSFNDIEDGDNALHYKTFNLKYFIEGLKNGVTGSKGEIILYENTFTIDTNI